MDRSLTLLRREQSDVCRGSDRLTPHPWLLLARPGTHPGPRERASAGTLRVNPTFPAPSSWGRCTDLPGVHRGRSELRQGSGGGDQRGGAQSMSERQPGDSLRQPSSSSRQDHHQEVKQFPFCRFLVHLGSSPKSPLGPAWFGLGPTPSALPCVSFNSWNVQEALPPQGRECSPHTLWLANLWSGLGLDATSSEASPDPLSLLPASIYSGASCSTGSHPMCSSSMV